MEATARSTGGGVGAMESQHTTGTSVHTGFPNAADDTRLQALSLDTLLVPHPNSTYYFRIAGSQWQAQGIFNGDLALIDKATQPRRGDLVVWWHNDEFSISQFSDLPERAQVWGIVTTTIHSHRRLT